MQQSLDPTTAEQIFAVCLGTRIEGLSADLIDHATTIDAIWGPYLTMVRGFAADPEVRFRGASGGVLSALADGGRWLSDDKRARLQAWVAESPRMAQLAEFRARLAQVLDDRSHDAQARH